MQGRWYTRKRNSDVLKENELLEESRRSPVYTLLCDETHWQMTGNVLAATARIVRELSGKTCMNISHPPSHISSSLRNFGSFASDESARTVFSTPLRTSRLREKTLGEWLPALREGSSEDTDGDKSRTACSCKYCGESKTGMNMRSVPSQVTV
jgi:hypothetical protein